MSPTQATIERHDQYMTLNYPRYEIVIAEAEGCIMKDSEGREYLDLFSGFGAGILGHCHPDLVLAGNKQMNKLWHVGNLLHTDPQTQLAKLIADMGFGGRSYFCFSGNDANESAFKLARLYGQGKRYKIISTLHSFHGRGFAGMMATGQDKVRKGFDPLISGFTNVPYNDLDAIKAATDDETVAVIIEPIQGEGGVHVPDDAYMTGLRAFCDEKDLLLICDEVWTGCGRTGKTFAYQHWDIEPDILTLGKAIGCGLPVGVMCASEKVATQFDFATYNGVAHATTLGGNCVSMAVAARLFELLEEQGLTKDAAEMGEYLIGKFNAMKEQFPFIKEVRGKGLFLGVEIDLEASPFESGAEIVDAALAKGLLINATQGNILRVAPPLIVSKGQLDQGLGILEQIFKG